MDAGTQHDALPVFGRRLRAARLSANLPQDKLGARIGLDELSSSARISRYETGVHEPPIKTAKLLAGALKVPLAYLYCEDDLLAQILLVASKLNIAEKRKLLAGLNEI